MNDNSYNIDFRKLAVEWLPTFLRNPVIIAFIVVLLLPVEKMYIEFLKVRKQHLIRMKHNFQKFSLQKRLNDAFDPLERRIKIVGAIQYNGVYLYTEAEDDAFFNKTKWLYDDSNPIYLRTEAELYSEYDFIVEIPNTSIDNDQLVAEIEFYMLQSKNYKIVII